MYEIPGFTFSAKTAAAQDSKYVFVKMTATGLAPATALTDAVVGVVQRKGIASEVLPVMANGISMVEASAAITKGALVGPTTGGKAVTSTTQYCGIALEAAAKAGDIIPVLLTLGAGAPAGGGG